MNSLASWIDQSLLHSIVDDLTSVDELTDDIGRLMRSGAAPTQSLNHQDFARAAKAMAEQTPEVSIATVGQTEAQLKRFRDCLENVSSRFQNSGLWKNTPQTGAEPKPTHTSEEIAAPPTSKRGISFFVAPQGTLGTRLRALREWLQAELPGLSQLFVIDAQGCLATDEVPPQPILSASIVLADAARRTSRHLRTEADCAMNTELSATEKLCVITADSPMIGAYSLALVSPYALPSGSTERIRAALLRALNGET
jgi:hypothetical protein